jgi:hypothetical protein
MLFEGDAECLKKGCNRMVLGIPKSKSQGELVLASEVQLASKGNIAVGNQVLKIADLRPIHRGIIDFGNDTIPQRKPDLAGSSVRSSHPVFSAMSPSGMHPRVAKRSILIV